MSVFFDKDIGYDMVMEKIKNISLSKKIFCLIIATAIILGIAYFVNLKILIDEYDKKLYKVTANGLQVAITAIEEEMNSLENLTYRFATDDEMQEKLSSLVEPLSGVRRGIVSKEIYEQMYKYFYMSPYITSIGIIVEDSMINLGKSFEISSDEKEKLENDALEKSGQAFWTYGNIDGGKTICARQIRQKKRITMKSLGTLYIDIDIANLVKDALKETGYSQDIGEIILYTEDDIVYLQDEEDKVLFEESSKIENENYSIEEINGEKKFIINGSARQHDWEYLYLQNYNKVFLGTLWMKIMTVLVIVICSVIVLCIMRIILKEIFKELDFLLQKIENFGSGKVLESDDSKKYENRTDEIAQLHKSFDEMSHNVKCLRDENYEKKILLRDAEIKVLEQQINPHFLYNTLDSINWMAQMYQADDISKMARALGNIFRISISEKRELVPLGEELEFLNNYIQIQKIRFKERLKFEIICPEGAEKLYIPKLCIQPLVENALKYALDCSDDICVIQILIEEVETNLKIQISNTGSEFEENLLDKIKNRVVIPQGSGVGLINIDSRLKLIFGEDYGLTFRNAEGKAIVQLCIPIEEKEEGKECYG